jgi:F-type H+-transporting ATPase subunit epsilon
MNKLSVVIKTREGILFEGEAEAVSARNTTGEFDILPEHSQFVTSITGAVKIHLDGGKLKVIELAQAILHVKDDKVEIFGQTLTIG